MIKTHAFALSDPGRVRQRNEDAFVSDEAHGIYAVADGVGGGPSGEVASACAVAAARASVEDELKTAATEPPGELLAAMVRRAVEAACAAVHELARPDGEHAGAATTLTLLVVRGPHAAVAHVGDSRLYLVRAGRLEQLTTDHTIANELLEMAAISPDDARRHPYRHVLSRALGSQATVLVDALALDLMPGDVYLLASDGLDAAMDEPHHVADVLAESELDEAVRALVDRANELGGPDNITVVGVHVERGEEAPRARAAEMLTHVPAFADLSLAARCRLVGMGRVESVPQGTTLVEPSEPFDGLYMVLNGSLTWETNPTPLELGAREWIGDTCLLEPRATGARLTATAPSEVFHLTSRDFLRLTRRRPHLGVRVLTKMARELAGRAPFAGPHGSGGHK